MALTRSTVTNAVNTAFNAVGELVQSGVLTTKDVTSYDWSTGNTVSTGASSTVDVIITSIQKPSGEGYTIQAIMKSGPDLSVYDTLVVGGKTYRIVDYSDNEFVIEAVIVREE